MKIDQYYTDGELKEHDLIIVCLYAPTQPTKLQMDLY
uniref:Uncharacterized protein n=1 Tax=Setaria italica TaxID=4555 RepID=K3YCM7_SETIT